jgi:membrane fusion protein, multidrug efflux system
MRPWSRYLSRAGWAGIFAALLAGCAERTVPIKEAPPAEVSVSRPISRSVVLYDEFQGKIDALDSVDVRARVNGYLDKITFESGVEVATGDLLFVIDQRPYQADLDSAKAAVAAANARKIKADLDYGREKQLRDKGSVSQEEFDRAVAAKAESDAAVQSSQAQQEKAQLNLDFASVRAPLAGKINRNQISVGNLVSADNTLLTTIVRLDVVVVYFDVDERALQRYRVVNQTAGPSRKEIHTIEDLKMPVLVGLTADRGFPHKGVIDFAENRVNATTGTVRVRGRFENPDRVLIPGYYARVRVRSGPAVPVLLVAERAIGTLQGERFVLVVNDKNKVEPRPVKLGRIWNGWRIVEEGIRSEDRLVVDGLQHVRPGETVAPHDAEMPRQAGAVQEPESEEEATADRESTGKSERAEGSQPAKPTDSSN